MVSKLINKSYQSVQKLLEWELQTFFDVSRYLNLIFGAVLLILRCLVYN